MKIYRDHSYHLKIVLYGYWYYYQLPFITFHNITEGICPQEIIYFK